MFQFKENYGWYYVPQCDQPSSQNRECFKPRLRGEWFTNITEQSIEQHLATTPLDCKALEEKARFNSMVAAYGVHELSSVAYLIIANAIANEGMLCVSPAGCGKSVLLKQAKAVLEGMQKKVRVCAYTHAACRMVNGETIAHLLHLNGLLADCWFWSTRSGCCR